MSGETTGSGTVIYNTVTYQENTKEPLTKEFVYDLFVFINAIGFIITIIVFAVKIQRTKGPLTKKVFNMNYIITGKK